MINVIVVTHGQFGAYLVEAAEEIVGAQAEGVRCVSISARMSVAQVRELLSKAVDELMGDDGLIVMVDMPGGTPCNVSLPIVKDERKVSVLSGVNLYMLVTAFNHRKDLPLSELSEKVMAAGKKSIADLKAMFLAKK